MPKVPKKAGKIGEMSAKESRNLFKALEREKQSDIKANLPEGSSYIDERKRLESDEAKDAWRKLIQEAKVKFPENLADKFALTPNKKISAIANMLGWSQRKISMASGIAESTLSKWFALSEVKEFMEAFEYYQGTKDGKDMLKREVYPSVQVLKEIRDDTSAPASVRRDISTWFFEQLHGKAKETREIKGYNIKNLTQQLMDLKKGAQHELQIDAELEEELDNEDETNVIQ